MKRWINAQTYKDFEWIIAMDEDSPETRQFCVDNGLKSVWQHNEGYRYGQIINKAVEIAEGQYIVICNADSYPKEDFLERLDMSVKPERVVNAIRVNVDDQGTIVSQDWRIALFGQDNLKDEERIVIPEPWRAMTFNGECVSRALYQKIGGMFDGYKLYGREDMDFNMRAHFDGAELWWANTAIIYHRDHPGREDNPANVELFHKRKAELEAKYGTAAKEQLIMNRERAQQKLAEQQKHLRAIRKQQEREEKEDLE